MPRPRRIVSVLFVAFLALCHTGIVRAADTPAKVYIVIWFDTEDYLLPASDDSALRLATFLKGQGIRATFKVVGEKARTLERRGRTDVIAALKEHEIGYHSNYHSTQPSPAMYLNELGWVEGVREFDRREKAGFDDVHRIFGQAPSCYGQPGSSWAPQAFGAIRSWGMQIYLDAGGHINLDDKPLYYDGIFTMYKLAHLQRAGLLNAQDAEKGEQQFLASRSALLKEGGGLVSIIYHPCEFVHKEFWDGVNFREGANPPRSAWKVPKEKTAVEKALAFGNFERYITFMRRFPDVQFVTASEALHLYRDDAASRAFSRDELKAIADQCTLQVSFVKQGDLYLSAAEVFSLLNTFVASSADGKQPASVQLKPTPYGPSRPVSETPGELRATSNQFIRTAVEIQDYLVKHGCIPDTVWLGSVHVSPETYLQGLASVATLLLERKELPETITLTPGALDAAKYVSDDDMKLWKWVIFPKGFHAPALMQLAKRQAWTIKPAVLHNGK
jgi:hypothetical protein